MMIDCDYDTKKSTMKRQIDQKVEVSERRVVVNAFEIKRG